MQQHGGGGWYQQMSDAELAHVHAHAAAQLVAIAGEVSRRLAMRPFGGAWSRGTSEAVVTAPPPAAQPPPQMLPEHISSSPREDVEYGRACTGGTRRDCACRYYFGPSDHGKVPTSVDLLTLFVQGIDAHRPHAQSRAAIIRALSGHRRARSEHVMVPAGKSVAYVAFATHRAATAAQPLLEEAGYRVNFLRKK